MQATETDTYFVVKFFDSDEDGKLTFPEYLQMVLPTADLKLRAECTQRYNMGCRP